MNSKSVYTKLKVLLSIALFSSFLIYETKIWGKYVFLGITVALLLIYVINHSWKVSINFGYYSLVTIPFVIFGYASAVWAINPSLTLNRMSTVIETVLCLYVVYINFSEDSDSNSFLDVIRWTGYFVSIYAISTYGMSTIRYIIQAGDRLDNDFANINSIGLIAAYSLIITFAKIYNKEFSWDILFSIPAAIITVASGSRKALLAVIIGISIIYFVKEVGKSKNAISALLRLFFTIGIIVAAIFVMLSIPALRPTVQRLTYTLNMFTGAGRTDTSSLNRMNYIQIGFEQFKKTPIFGIGIDNSRVISGTGKYLHSNVFELLACGGIVGTIAFYWGFIYLLNLLRKSKNMDINTILCIALIIIQLVLDFAQVSYFSKDTYMYLMLFSLQALKVSSSNNDNEAEVIKEG